MARRGPKNEGLAQALTLVVLAAPVLVLVAAMGARAGGWSVETGYDLLTLQVAWWLSFAGAAAALAVLVLAFRDLKRLGFYAAVAVLAAGGTLGVFVWQKGRMASGVVENVSTDLVEVPGFGEERRRWGAGPAEPVGPEACPGARSLPHQVAPEKAVEALEAAGFTVRGAGVGRATADRTGFWFGFMHDAVVRIRPGRTDIHVAARDSRAHGGEACRFATRISETLYAGR